MLILKLNFQCKSQNCKTNLSKADELAKEEVSLYRLALIIILIHYVMIIVSKDVDITFTLCKIIS